MYFLDMKIENAVLTMNFEIIHYQFQKKFI